MDFRTQALSHLPRLSFNPSSFSFFFLPLGGGGKKKEERVTRRAGDKWRGESSLNPPGGIPESTPKPQLSAQPPPLKPEEEEGKHINCSTPFLHSRLEGSEIAKCRRIVRIFYFLELLLSVIFVLERKMRDPACDIP